MINNESSGEHLPVRAPYMVGRLGRVVQRALERRLISYELTIAEFTALSVLIRRPGLSNAQLARRSYITPQSMQELLLRLEDRGLVRRTPDPANRRVLRARLTEAGELLILRAEQASFDIEALMFDGLTQAKQKNFTEAMRHCITRLGGGFDYT